MEETHTIHFVIVQEWESTKAKKALCAIVFPDLSSYPVMLEFYSTDNPYDNSVNMSVIEFRIGSGVSRNCFTRELDQYGYLKQNNHSQGTFGDMAEVLEELINSKDSQIEILVYDDVFKELFDKARKKTNWKSKLPASLSSDNRKWMSTPSSFPPWLKNASPQLKSAIETKFLRGNVNPDAVRRRHTI